eukprot:5363000-Pyramimonas_sp.AAC.1
MTTCKKPSKLFRRALLPPLGGNPHRSFAVFRGLVEARVFPALGPSPLCPSQGMFTPGMLGAM